jgi:hypothetical protein
LDALKEQQQQQQYNAARQIRRSAQSAQEIARMQRSCWLLGLTEVLGC